MFHRSLRRRFSETYSRAKIYVRNRFQREIDFPVDSLRNTQLHLAVRNGKEKKVLQLLRRGADVNLINILSETPLHLAVEHGHANLIDHLVMFGADVEARKYNSSTPMHLVEISKNPFECLEQLIKHGADVNARDAVGNNILQLTIKCTYQNIKMIKRLLHYGSNINNQDSLNNCYLHNIAMDPLISEYEIRASAEVLIAEGIDLNVKNIFGETPLHKAVFGENEHLVRILLQNGAKLDMQNDENINPFDMAVKNEYLNSLHVMIKHLVLRFHRGEPVEEKIKKTLTSNHNLMILYERYETELHSLKLSKIYNFSTHSYYDILCGDECKLINIVRNEFSLYVLENISSESTKFYWEIVDRWNGARKHPKSNEIEIETKEEYLLSL